MNNLLKKLKHGTILEEPVRIQGTILRASVIAPGGPGCSSLVFVLEEDPSIAYQVQNWAVGNHQIVFSAAGDKVSFLYRQGLRKS